MVHDNNNNNDTGNWIKYIVLNRLISHNNKVKLFRERCVKFDSPCSVFISTENSVQVN